MRDILTSPRATEINRRRRTRRVRLLILILILVISLGGALAYFSADRHLTINTIIVTGNKFISTNDVQTLIQKDISGRYLHLFARANSLIYPQSKIYNDLISTFTRIEHVTISRDNLNTLHISIVERSGIYLYCGPQIPILTSDIGENCYFVNSDGYIFDKAPYFSGDVYFKYYAPLQDDTNQVLGKQILTPTIFHTVQKFIAGVTALGFVPTDIVVSSNEDYVLHLASSALIVPTMMFNHDDDLLTILDNLRLSMQKPEFANSIKEKYATLQYIDLRFKNKVLYKFN
jgi:hypothetical protein